MHPSATEAPGVQIVLARQEYSRKGTSWRTLIGQHFLFLIYPKWLMLQASGLGCYLSVVFYIGPIFVLKLAF